MDQPRLFEGEYKGAVDFGERIRKRDKEAVREVAIRAGFEEWWKIWPEKKQRTAAEAAFVFNLTNGERERLVERTQDYLNRRSRARAAKLFVPYLPNPSTYLNQKRWEDTFKTDDVPEHLEVHDGQAAEMVKRFTREYGTGVFDGER